jgi:hypothetical protein
MKKKLQTNQADLLTRLQTWYLANCNGDWEHKHGIHIETLDNPGWLVKIELARTTLKRRPFTKIAEGISEAGHPVQSHWLHCSVRDGVWEGAADGSQLSRLLALFLEWADEGSEKDLLSA